MAAAGEAATPRKAGGWRLADTSSAYLKGAAEQAIDWYPWGTEAFEVARRTNRPILLDIGAAWCHWCHVMDEGTYSDVEVARLLRQHFVSVKVDRDENPEVDRRYQRRVSALTGEGGWPLTAFLTPSGEVFLGGTYFPPQDAMGRPGFRRVLREVARVWKEEPQSIERNAGAVRGALGRARSAEERTAGSVSAFIAHVRESVLESFDPVNGGFGQAPKFPHPTAVGFLLWDSFVTREEASADRARLTLLRMADGGLHDQIAGGFHRYSVDEGWHIPHFEKMAVDNAALLEAYVEGCRRFEEPRFLQTVRDTVGWTRDVLGDPKGGFGASQDADNAPGDDGSYYTWSRAELKAALPSNELRLVTRFFGVGSDGRMPHDPERNVLFRLMPLAEAVEGLDLEGRNAVDVFDGAIAKLRKVRLSRPTPLIDRALYANLNGAYIRALVHAGRLLAEPEPIELARRAADRFLAEGFEPDRGVAHRLERGRGIGFGRLDDQAEFAYGLVELAGATATSRYAEVAESMLTIIDHEFRTDSGLLQDIAPRLYDGPSVGVVAEPSFPLEDSPHLSANSAAALAMIRLAGLIQNEGWLAKARALVGAMQERIGHAGLFAAGGALAAGLLETPVARIVVEGGGPDAQSLKRAADLSWHPNAWAFSGIPPAPFSLPEELSAKVTPGRTRLLACFGTRCLAPIEDPSSVRALLANEGRTATAE